MFRDVDKRKIRRRWVLKNIFWLFLLIATGVTAYYFFVPFLQQVSNAESSADSDKKPLKDLSVHAHENVSENLQDWFKPGVMSDPYKVVDSIDKVKTQGGWFNTAPLDINYLLQSGHYVLLYFWSSSSIESVRTNKYVEWLWQQYKDSGLVVIGVHSPRFSADSSPSEVQHLIKKQGITFPVLLDGDKKIWNKFHVYEVPTQFLLSPKSKIVYSYVGEGNYEKETQIIRESLIGAGWLQKKQPPLPALLTDNQLTTTQTLYTGYNYKRRLFGNKNQGIRNKVATFAIDSEILPDRLYLSGKWRSMPDYIESESQGELLVNFLGSQVYVYLEATEEATHAVQVLLNGISISPNDGGSAMRYQGGKSYISVSDVAKLYEITNANLPYGRHELIFYVPKGVKLYLINFPERPVKE